MGRGPGRAPQAEELRDSGTLLHDPDVFLAWFIAMPIMAVRQVAACAVDPHRR